MGNRSSSHYPPPPHWMHQRTSYSTQASPYPESKQRPIAPGAFVEPYLVQNHHHHPQSKAQMRRSMVSLNADSGYMGGGGPDSERLRHMRGSRMSLNQVDFEPQMAHMPPPPRLIIPPDAKTLKKLEKMEKKHQKLMKKLGARGIPLPMPVGPPPPPMHPMYSRAMSFDDLHRMHEAPEIDVRMRNNRDWRATDERRGMPTRRETQSQYVKQHNYSSTNRRTELNGSLASSSPMTSSEEGGHSSDPWNTSSISSGKRDVISPPMYSSTPHHQIASPQPSATPVTKTIEVKVERSEKTEQRSEHPNEQKLLQNQNQTTSSSSTTSRIQHHHHVAPPQSNATYAQPIIRGQPSYNSRSSSIATSAMRCDQSEIDFSWVNEEEDKLKRESRRVESSLPECYFGMEPPLVASDSEKENEEEKRRRRKSSVLEKTAAFEIEARRSDRKEPSFLSRSSHHLNSSEIPHPDYSPLSIHTKETGGPAERRIYRIQKQQHHQQSSDHRTSSEDRRYRSSIAF